MSILMADSPSANDIKDANGRTAKELNSNMPKQDETKKA
jgi:hypothetical protein